MSGNSDPGDREFDEVSLRLNESLKSCHAVISGYKALLAPDQDNQPGSESQQTAADGSSDV